MSIVYNYINNGKQIHDITYGIERAMIQNHNAQETENQVLNKKLEFSNLSNRS